MMANVLSLKKAHLFFLSTFSVPLCISKTLDILQKLKISFSRQHNQNNYSNFIFAKIMFGICFCGVNITHPTM